MVLVVSILTVSLLIGVPLARAAGRRRGHRLAHPEAFQTMRDKAKDTALFLAALVPSVLVWLAVMGVSFIGLTGFAADVMQWHHWTNILVPLSLDGISVSFGAWAFVAVKRGRHPGRAYKIVLAAATMSAVLNFVHGRDRWSIWAGAYLAFLSMAGMAMFHELLDQFMAAYDDEVALKTRYPRFGQRWLYAPVSTFAARRAWIVHPPEDGYRPSVRNALDHLQAVREAKRQNRLAGALRVREEAQAQLVAVEARAEVRRAKASGRRAEPGRRPPMPPPQHMPMHMPQHTPQHSPQHAPPFEAPHLQAAHLQAQQFTGAQYDSPAPVSPAPPSAAPVSPAPAPGPVRKAAGKAPAPRAPESQPASAPVSSPIFDPGSRAELESILSTSGREVLGRRPLAEPPVQRAEEPAVNGRETRRPLSNQRVEEVQRMIAEAMAVGEDVQPEMVMDWVQRQYSGQRPSYQWARDQILAVRSRDAVGLDADLV
jgi:hypothetical protein